jgi:hypothetical protein
LERNVVIKKAPTQSTGAGSATARKFHAFVVFLLRSADEMRSHVSREEVEIGSTPRRGCSTQTAAYECIMISVENLFFSFIKDAENLSAAH